MCKVYRSGIAMASAGTLQGLSGVLTRVYICQDNSLIAWFESLCGRYIFLEHTYAVTQTVQIRGIIMTQRYRFRISAGSDVCHRAVHIQCSKLFKGLESAVLSIVLCTINNP